MTVDPGPELGEMLYNWEGTDLNGQTVVLEFPRRRDLFLFFLSPHCTVCTELMPAARSFIREISDRAETMTVMTHGSRQLQREYSTAHQLNEYHVLQEEELPEGWYVGGAPFGIWVERTGKVLAKGMVDRREHLESLKNAADLGLPTMQSLQADRTRPSGDTSVDESADETARSL
ncbi:MAG: hypothetical protein MJE77_19285 [Proteobacteria bacterium]|nr:hypothetical protein [Pseudomonadota bacterium]